MRRNQWAAALFALIIFCCGIAVGVLADRYYDTEVVVAKTTPAENFRKHYVSQMRSRLDLTPAQVAQLETILDDTKAKYKDLRDKYRPQVAEIKNGQIERVKSILNPHQVPIYEQMVKEHEQHAQEEQQREHLEEHKHHPH
jgi:Spy/CpxP family protein refolding chaperone